MGTAKSKKKKGGKSGRERKYHIKSCVMASRCDSSHTGSPQSGVSNMTRLRCHK